MNSELEKLEKLGGDIASALGQGPGETRRRAQQQAFLNYLRGRRPTRRRLWVLAPVVFGCALLIAVVCWLCGIGVAPSNQELKTRQGEVGRLFSLEAGEEVKFQFDGGWLRLEGRSQGRILEAGREQVRIWLERGAVLTEVESRLATEWIVEAGPCRVTVLGTVFFVNWEPQAGLFGVRVVRGRVLVQGSDLATDGKVLEAGEQIRLDVQPRLPETTSQDSLPDRLRRQAAQASPRWTPKCWLPSRPIVVGTAIKSCIRIWAGDSA